MKWMLVCLFVSMCGEPSVNKTRMFETQEECLAEADKDNKWLEERHKDGARETQYKFQCLELNQ